LDSKALELLRARDPSARLASLNRHGTVYAIDSKSLVVTLRIAYRCGLLDSVILAGLKSPCEDRNPHYDWIKEWVP